MPSSKTNQAAALRRELAEIESLLAALPAGPMDALAHTITASLSDEAERAALRLERERLIKELHAGARLLNAARHAEAAMVRMRQQLGEIDAKLDAMPRVTIATESAEIEAYRLELQKRADWLKARLARAGGGAGVDVNMGA